MAEIYEDYIKKRDCKIGETVILSDGRKYTKKGSRKAAEPIKPIFSQEGNK